MFGTKTKKSTGHKAPISSHPLFPAVIALWFAALLGLGSLVLPVALFEKIVSVTGVSSVISAAQPPLGTTARIAIAVLAALAGAVAGLLIARKVVAAQTPDAPKRGVFGRSTVAKTKEDSAKKPISAHEELGSESLDEPISQTAAADGAYAGKRRALAVTDDSGPSDYFEDAPLPGGPAMVDQHIDAQSSGSFEADAHVAGLEGEEPQDNAPLELAELDLAEMVAEDPQTELAEIEAAEVGVPVDPAASIGKDFEAARARLFDAPDPVTPSNEIPHASFDPPHDPVAELREEFGTMTDQFDPVEPATDTRPIPEPSLDSAPAQAPIPATYNPLDGAAAPAEPTSNPFAAPLEIQGETVGEFAQPIAAPAPTPSFQTPAAEEATVSPRDVTGSALNDLGMVELVERFALALQAKADAEAQASEEEAAEETPLVFQRSSSTDSAAPFAPSGAEDAGNAVAEFFATPASAPEAEVPAEPVVAEEPPVPAPFVPAALQPLGFDDVDDDEDEVAPLSLTMNTAHQPFARSAEPAAEEAAHEAANAAPPRPAQFAALDDIDDDDEAEDESAAAYSSLLAMKSPFESGQDFVRVEDDGDDLDGLVQPAVVFPGSERRAAPAADGPTRDPILETEPAGATAPRPFDAPNSAPTHGATKAVTKANPGETEQALRDALEKLQRMSGAA